MPEGIENPELRMQVLQQSMAPRQQNPQAFGPLTPAAMAIIENRMKFLSHQAEQMQNAVIGRTGTKPVFEEGIGRKEAQGAQSLPGMGGGMQQ